MRHARSILAAAAIASLVPHLSAQCSHVLAEDRRQPAVVAVGDVFVIAGGLDGGPNPDPGSFEVHDAAGESWVQLPLTHDRIYVSGAAAGSLALLAGGANYSPTFQYNFTSLVEVYDTVSGATSQEALSVARGATAAITAGGKTYFAGGMIYGAPPFGGTDQVDVRDVATGSWTTAQLISPRFFVAAVEVGGRVMFAGGAHFYGLSPDVDVVDPSTGMWTTTSLPLARGNMAAVASGTRAFFAGGFEPDPNNPIGWSATDRVEVYDAVAGTWSLERLSEPRYGVATFELGGRLLFAGGSDPLGNPTEVVDVFDPATNEWSSFRLELASGVAGGASNGLRALVVGGAADILYAGFPRVFCAGDGGGSACACGNEGAAGAGCVNSTGVGARLEGRGCQDLDAFSLSFEATGLPAGQPALFFAGLNATVGGAGAPFGDGLRCVGGEVQRLAIETSSIGGMAMHAPDATAHGWAPGELRRFQLWYRDPSGPCGTGFNTTPGVELSFAP